MEHRIDTANEPHHLTEAMSKRPRSQTHKHARASDAEFQHRVPVDFHPASLGDDDNTQAHQKATAALEALWDVHSKMLEAAVTIQNKAALADRLEPEVGRTARRMKEGIDTLERHAAHHDAEIKKEIGTGLGGLASEIRAYVRSLKPTERTKFLQQAITSGDREGVKAIIATPAYLAGIDTNEVYFELVNLGQQMLSPNSYAERAKAQSASVRAQRALENFETTMKRNINVWRSGDDARLQAFMASIAPKKD